MAEQDKKIPLDYANSAIPPEWRWGNLLQPILGGLVGLSIIAFGVLYLLAHLLSTRPDPWANEKLLGYFVAGFGIVIWSLVRLWSFVRRRRQSFRRSAPPGNSLRSRDFKHK
jgi:hypothetical protein